MMDLFDQHLGHEWRGNLTNREFWDSVDDIPDNLFWGVHQNLKKRMIDRIRERRVDQLLRNGEATASMREVEQLLDPNLLTIGFARRFATYKRATLLFSDLDRLARIVNDPERPVQFVFAGKAHPADIPGQELLKRIYAISQTEPFKGRVVLVEGYDIAIGSIKTIPPVFNTDRMVGEYASRFYFNAIPKGKVLAARKFKGAKALATWKAKIRQSWNEVQIHWAEPNVALQQAVDFGQEIEIDTRVQLVEISTQDVSVEAYIVDLCAPKGEETLLIPLKAMGPSEGGVRYQGTFVPPDSGKFTVTVRAVPCHVDLVHPYDMGLVSWLTGGSSGHQPISDAARDTVAEGV